MLQRLVTCSGFMRTSIGAGLPLAVRKQRDGRKLVPTPGGMALRSAAADTTLVKALARAFRWRRMIEAGPYGTIDELAAAESINSSYVSRLLRLTMLAPDIVQAILDGRQPKAMTLQALLEPFPIEWDRQRTNNPMPIIANLVLAPGARAGSPP
ncbi:hypothetical protein [Plastoroseomonas arctica]|uniref:hypothetical protein n=1 Tax=Plastoroseomonas arctica TaxID=1509237 RepID=UPI001FE2CB15|nr:hypothetical protein [Plastoroseomonas arctica]